MIPVILESLDEWFDCFFIRDLSQRFCSTVTCLSLRFFHRGHHRGYRVDADCPTAGRNRFEIRPAGIFSLMIMGLTVLTFLASGPMWKALLMAAFGLFLGCMGMDNMTASYRFTFNILELSDGVGLVPVVMGLFGISEVMLNVEQSMERSIFKTKIEHLLPTMKDWAASLGPIARGTLLGFFLGVLPGGGAVISSFVSYAVEKRISKHPEKFGSGAIEGVAGPESANNAAAQCGFIPLLALGIPSNIATALLLGGLILTGVQPGPMLISTHPDLFWGTIASMYIGNVMLLILNLPLVGLWARISLMPYKYLAPSILDSVSKPN
jgi:putative tricarboxylic transport membrane protein